MTRIRDAANGYLIQVEGPDRLGNYTARCPSIPGCLGYAKSPVEAAEGAAAAIEPILRIWQKQGHPLPEPELTATFRKKVTKPIFDTTSPTPIGANVVFAPAV